MNLFARIAHIICNHSLFHFTVGSNPRSILCNRCSWYSVFTDEWWSSNSLMCLVFQNTS